MRRDSNHINSNVLLKNILKLFKDVQDDLLRLVEYTNQKSLYSLLLKMYLHCDQKVFFLIQCRFDMHIRIQIIFT